MGCVYHYISNVYKLYPCVYFYNSSSEKYYKKYGREEGIEEILLCEIGFEKGYSFISFCTADGTEVSIYFKQFKIEEIKNSMNASKKLDFLYTAW